MHFFMWLGVSPSVSLGGSSIHMSIICNTTEQGHLSYSEVKVVFGLYGWLFVSCLMWNMYNFIKNQNKQISC